MTIKGYMTPASLNIDKALLLLHAALISSKGNCLVPKDTLALVAIRASVSLAQIWV